METGATVRFIAMEYVPDARPITRYADEKSLSRNERLELFVHLCDAIHCGHRKGVIHRDLKPANVLIDGEGCVKVIDFGIARTTDSDIAVTTMHTEAGQILGTLAYMSPEQCSASAGEIDTRTDVYSLGVVLFELLSGRLPYDVSHMTIHAAARVICEQEPARPSAFTKRGIGNQSRGVTSHQAVKGDLETVILKCIEKDRARRYATVAELRADLRSVLRGEPIAARPPTAYSRLLRWAGRHPKLAVATTSLIIAVLVVGSAAASIWLAFYRPDRLELTKRGSTWDDRLNQTPSNGERARLISMGGVILKDWNGYFDSSIAMAALVDRPNRWGGGKVVVLGFTVFAKLPFVGELCIFDASHPNDEPIRRLRVEQAFIDRMPPDAWPRPSLDRDRHYESSGFSVKHGWMIDVFPGDDHPGDEIVVFFQHDPGSQGVLRIYNLNGDLLFQAWQDGGFDDAYWLSQSRRLVLSAIKGDKDGFEYGLRLEQNHPKILLAIQPSAGEITNAWINPHAPDWGPADWYQPVWCRMPCPIEFNGNNGFYNVLNTPTESIGERAGDEFVGLQVLSDAFPELSGVPIGFSVVFNEHGDIVSKQLSGDQMRNFMRENPGKLPDPGRFELLPWTQRQPPCGVPTSQPSATQPAAEQFDASGGG